MIGILGGTFDPIHFGHLRTALDVQEALGLEQVRFLPLNQAVHRPQPQASPTQRLQMVQLAIADRPGFVADASELQRGGASYMLDTLGHLRQQLGTDTPLGLLLGTDAFNDFLSWREPQQVADLCHLLLMTRPGYQLPQQGELAEFVTQRLRQAPAELTGPGGRIYLQPVTQLAISATDLRQRAHQGRGLAYLLPEPVRQFIQSEGLYSDTTGLR
ncbi:MAG: nicotinate-nucleotide adenylyltransferase [Gammaproteobacteria bacterium SHHR-1]|uniref:nicotinate-nucleotide adenylyltransferase n=1 Tax=Magnetovirga frankeli TaxID=947516 RepID=UPI001293B094|nr:nicotinate-nucleotide adenylyltransferase [gamma proteobacterium SS-5]